MGLAVHLVDLEAIPRHLLTPLSVLHRQHEHSSSLNFAKTQQAETAGTLCHATCDDPAHPPNRLTLLSLEFKFISFTILQYLGSTYPVVCKSWESKLSSRSPHLKEVCSRTAKQTALRCINAFSAIIIRDLYNLFSKRSVPLDPHTMSLSGWIGPLNGMSLPSEHYTWSAIKPIVAPSVVSLPSNLA